MDWLPGSNAGGRDSKVGHFRVGVEIGHLSGEPILGVVTLEEFLLAADRVHRRLVSVPGLLKRGEQAA